MKKLSFNTAVLAVIVSVSIFSSCRRLRCVHGSGNIITENRKANDFTKLDISDAFKVHLKQDSSLSISIKGDDNQLKYVSTSVEGGTLHIKSKKNFCDGDSIVINIGIKKLDEIDASGAVVISSVGKINTGDLKFGLSGATKLNLDVNAANVVTENSGMAEVNLTGQAASHKIESSGISKVNAFDFVVGDYDINTSGIGNCKINVLKTLNVHSSGASEVQYKGSPATVNNDKSGASKITKVD
ncbi:head GIN domain-containing protein [Mucilaginibacter dorajii]|uniref:Head GIN domain-containing protein n=1 Tax=Mucilaginibacter dorajii TaxID=692994 RepID=A0ABP7QDT7_9SPHI|nr:head GIN domain-containing protein [Mucilaginibacter dorajii]MCS3733291.1 hypothetical protein [Mucilaginibacter dorajii]